MSAPKALQPPKKGETKRAGDGVRDDGDVVMVSGNNVLVKALGVKISPVSE